MILASEAQPWMPTLLISPLYPFTHGFQNVSLSNADAAWVNGLLQRLGKELQPRRLPLLFVELGLNDLENLVVHRVVHPRAVDNGTAGQLNR